MKIHNEIVFKIKVKIHDLLYSVRGEESLKKVNSLFFLEKKVTKKKKRCRKKPLDRGGGNSTRKSPGKR